MGKGSDPVTVETSHTPRPSVQGSGDRKGAGDVSGDRRGDTTTDGTLGLVTDMGSSVQCYRA